MLSKYPVCAPEGASPRNLMHQATGGLITFAVNRGIINPNKRITYTNELLLVFL